MANSDSMRNLPDSNQVRLNLQSAGISLAGISQLRSGRIVANPRDRALLVRLILLVLERNSKLPALAFGRQVRGAQTARSHPPSLVPPAPPTPLPGLGPVMPVPAPPPSDGVPDSIWIDLGYPVGVARRQLGRTGLSNEAVEELLAARPILSGEDREILARIVTGLNTRSES